MKYKNVTTFVLAGGKGERLYPLTKDRAKPAVPFGGSYRIIDFTLSNAVNSGLRKIYVLTQYKSFSLQRHIREGWNILSKELGEFIEIVPAQQRMGEDWYLGTADAIFQNIYILEKEKPEYVLILSGDHIYKMDYTKMINFHIEKKADLTIAVFEVLKEEASRFGVLKIDEENRIIDFLEKPSEPFTLPSNPSISLISMGIYIFKTEILVKRLIEDAKNPTSSHDFGKDVIPVMIKKDNVFAYKFIEEKNKESRYWKDIGTVDAYYQANMELLDIEPVLNLYDINWPIMTYKPQNPPAKIVFLGKNIEILNSLISDGCIISGSSIYNSIISPNVKIEKGTEIFDSIIMNNVFIGENCKIKRTIIDKNVIIPNNTIIGYNISEDRKRFLVTENDIVVIPRGSII
ncbi:MAG: glucose-1-phosphate adenylyltransferase [Candidatus Omnitrophica bacterium]|nr:glucose-1-phosphate adenylyltransferase [Candidatus Omnitrophota bacterium]